MADTDVDTSKYAGTVIGPDGKRYPAGEAPAAVLAPDLTFVYGTPGPGKVPVWNATEARWEFGDAGTDPATIQTQVDDAVNALVDGAPAALNTLNELAAAVGDDANFAGVVTAQLGALGTASTHNVPASGDAGATEVVLGNDSRLGGARPVVTKTAAYAAADGDIVLADATTAAFTVTLPAVGANKRVTVKKIDPGSNAITVAPASGTVDGAASRPLTTQYETFEVVCDGTNWFVV